MLCRTMPSAMFLNEGCSIFPLLAFDCPMVSAPCPQNSHAGSKGGVRRHPQVCSSNQHVRSVCICAGPIHLYPLWFLFVLCMHTHQHAQPFRGIPVGDTIHDNQTAAIKGARSVSVLFGTEPALFSIIWSIPDLVFSGCEMMRICFG